MWSIGHSRGMLDRMRSENAAVFVTAADPRRTWMEVRDPILRGLVHALSNRVGTVVAASGMLDAGSVDVAGQVLRGEADRLESLVTQFRLATADPFGAEAVPEPLVLADVVADVVALRGSVADVGEAALTCEGDVPPVVTSRVGLVHAVLLLLRDGATALRAVATRDGVSLRAEPAPITEALDAAVWLLAGSGARTAGGALILRALGQPGTAHARGAPS